MAEAVVERGRVVEPYLAAELAPTPHEAALEAEVLEHHLSASLQARMEQALRAGDDTPRQALAPPPNERAGPARRSPSGQSPGG